jgi:hypothetical protein
MSDNNSFFDLIITLGKISCINIFSNDHANMVFQFGDMDIRFINK